MNEPSLWSPASPRRAPVVPILGAVAVGVIGLLVLGAVVSAAFTLLGVLIPIGLLALGAHFLGERRATLGWLLVVIGVVMLLT